MLKWTHRPSMWAKLKLTRLSLSYSSNRINGKWETNHSLLWLQPNNITDHCLKVFGGRLALVTKLSINFVKHEEISKSIRCPSQFSASFLNYVQAQDTVWEAELDVISKKQHFILSNVQKRTLRDTKVSDLGFHLMAHLHFTFWTGINMINIYDTYLLSTAAV